MINVRRIFYVTSHFHVLKGLTFVPWGLYYLAGGVFALTQPTLSDMTLLGILFGGILLAVLAQLLIARYYQQTLGTVGEPVQKRHIPANSTTRKRRIWLWSGFILVSVLIGLFFICGGVYNHLLLTRSLQKQEKVRSYVTRI
jgi:hypothetical protein